MGRDDGLVLVCLAWIASKVKAVAPAIPTAAPTSTIPSANNPGAKGSGGSMIIPGGERLSTKRRGHRKKPKTTPSPPLVTTTASGNDDEAESSNGGAGEGETKAAIKRVIRALFNRQ